MDARAIWRHARDRLRRHGAVATAQLVTVAALRRVMVIERVFLYALPPTGDHAMPPDREVRPATLDELCSLRDDPTYDLRDFTRDEMARRFDAGHECVVNVMDGRIAGYAWMDPNTLVVPPVGVTFALHPHEIHIYKGLTHPDYRGRHLGHDRYTHWRGRLAALGRSTIVSYFSFDNPSTLARVESLDMRRLGTATLIGAGKRSKRIFEGTLDGREVLHVDSRFFRSHDSPRSRT